MTLPNRTEVILKNKNWFVTINQTRRSGWIEGNYHGSVRVSEPWGYYADELHVDKSDMVPGYVKEAILKEVDRQL